eukprot:1986886-Rhodomonas_salina.4
MEVTVSLLAAYAHGVLCPVLTQRVGGMPALCDPRAPAALCSAGLPRTATIHAHNDATIGECVVVLSGNAAIYDASAAVVGGDADMRLCPAQAEHRHLLGCSPAPALRFP